ncbi:ABC transporter ATP-binding protein [Chitinibacteraceae bacterium HSL-7]
MSSAVALSGVCFTWPGAQRPALDLAPLTIQRGERVFLHGPSGCGKSTLLGLLTGIHRADSGQVTMLDTDLTTLGASARDRFRADHIGYVFQQFNLLGHLDIVGNVILPCRFSNKRKEASGNPRQAALALLDRLGLGELTRGAHPVSRLSIGQQQRVALARALIGAPELIIADEPTSALDADRRDAFIDLLLETAGDTTVIMVSHDAALASHFDHSIALTTLNRAGARPDV